MNEQPLDLRRSLLALRRHATAVGIVTALGLLAGTGYTILNPPAYDSSALVVLSSSVRNAGTQVVIAGSNPVLAGALPDIKPATSLQDLSRRVNVSNTISNVLSIDAQGSTAAQAESTANAVARSYVAYVSTGRNPGGQVHAQVLDTAASATGTWLPIQVIITSLVGALLGALTGSIGVLAISRGDRRLRRRDEIADAIGLPVLASVQVRHPGDVGQWARLLEDYEPSISDARRLSSALRYLGLPSESGGHSVSVLSLSSDHRALALGPQLAAFAAAQGIPTTLAICPGQDTKVTAALRAACAGPSPVRRSGQLRVAVAGQENTGHAATALTIAVTVVDGRAPELGTEGGSISPVKTTRGNATVLGVSAGTTTAEQLARVAATAAADGRHIAGILVADPDPADPTTGRLPQLARPIQVPTRQGP